MKTLLSLIVLVALISVPVMAQDTPKAEVFGGYQYTRLNNVGGSGVDINANGWDGAVTGYFNKYFGVTGDFSGSYKTFSQTIQGVSVNVPVRIYTYSGGPVIAYREGKINPFVHALFGGVHVSAKASAAGQSVSVSENGFTTMVGGGVDAQLNKAVAVRLAQFDWVYYHISGESFSNNFRLSTGIVFRF